MCDLEGVDKILYFHESKRLATVSSANLSHDGYLLLTRCKWYVQDRYEAEKMRMKRMYQQGELGGSFEEWLENQVVQDGTELSHAYVAQSQIFSRCTGFHQNQNILSDV